MKNHLQSGRRHEIMRQFQTPFFGVKPFYARSSGTCFNCLSFEPNQGGHQKRGDALPMRSYLLPAVWKTDRILMYLYMPICSLYTAVILNLRMAWKWLLFYNTLWLSWGWKDISCRLLEPLQETRWPEMMVNNNRLLIQ